MYSWLVFLHVAGVFGFLLTHGVSVAAMFRLRRERDRRRIRTLVELSSASMTAFYVSVAVLLAGGIAAGFVGNWWRQGWIWLSLALFLGISAVMYPLARGYFRRISAAASVRPSGAPMASDEELDELLRSRRPVAIAAVGFGGLLAILWLMLFKPF